MYVFNNRLFRKPYDRVTMAELCSIQKCGFGRIIFFIKQPTSWLYKRPFHIKPGCPDWANFHLQKYVTLCILFSTIQLNELISTQHGLGNILGDFFCKLVRLPCPHITHRRSARAIRDTIFSRNAILPKFLL
jgi:hypothetical protein